MYNEFTFKHNMKYVYVDWDITSRCNFSCYYCNPEAHDGKYNFPSLDVAKNFVDKVKQVIWCLYYNNNYLIGGTNNDSL